MSIAQRHQHFLLNTYPFRGKTFVRGEGNYLFGENNTAYLDCMTNYGVNIFGYQHPTLTATLTQQLQTLPTLHNSFANPIRAEAAQKLAQRCGQPTAKVYFSNSGSEAIEAALKYAILASGKKKIIAAQNSYHGKTWGALNVTANPKYRHNLESFLWEVSFVEYGNINALQKLIDSDTAAVILEPVQGEGGIHPAPRGYLSQVSELCQQNETFFILDEIQSGTGRTGYFLASQKEGVQANIVCLGKGVGGGIPVGITLVDQSIATKIPKGAQTSTFGGNPLACQGILTTLELLDNSLLTSIQKTGELFQSALQDIQHERIVSVRGEGLMLGVEVTGDRDAVLKNLQKRHVLACPAGENVVRFLPPYTLTDQEVKKVVKALKESL